VSLYKDLYSEVVAIQDEEDNMGGFVLDDGISSLH
jgi:hypothetical protein